MEAAVVKTKSNAASARKDEELDDEEEIETGNGVLCIIYMSDESVPCSDVCDGTN